jgi:type II secretory pathway component PulF
LVALSGFFVNYGLILFLGLFALGIFIWKYIKTPTGRRIKSKVEIKLPIVGTLFQNIYLSRLAENLGTLIKGGLPIVQSLGIVAEVVGNTLYKDTLRNCQNAVRRGETIASTFSESEIIPPTFSQMVSAGEKSGKTQDVLVDLAKFYNGEVDTMISNLMSLLEPVLIVIMGIMVGFIAAAVLLPVYQLAGSI